MTEIAAISSERRRSPGSDDPHAALRAVIDAWRDVRITTQAVNDASGDAVINALIPASEVAQRRFSEVLDDAREWLNRPGDECDASGGMKRAIARIARADDLGREWFERSEGCDDETADAIVDDAVAAAAEMLRLENRIAQVSRRDL